MADLRTYTNYNGGERDTVPCLHAGGAHDTVSITENATLTRGAGRIVRVSPDAAYNITADVIEDGRDHTIINISTQFSLTLKNPAGTTIATVRPGCAARVWCESDAWRGRELGGLIYVALNWNPGSADYVGFVAPRPCRVIGVSARVETAGTDGGAVTAAVKKAASGTAIASGTAVHSGTINLKGTAATNQSITVAEADAAIPTGTALGLDVTGTLTSATGTATVMLVEE